MKKLSLNLGFANLVVEIYNSDYPVPEIVVSLESEDNMQDIAVIRQAINKENEKQEAVECLIYSDKDNEDYTHKFNIGHHKFEI